MSELDPAAPVQVVAGDLTREYHGWLMTYELPPVPDPPFGPPRRTIVLGGVRRWTHDDVDWVGLLGLEDGKPWRGTEYRVNAATEVRLERQIKRGIPKPRKNDYPIKEPADD